MHCSVFYILPFVVSLVFCESPCRSAYFSFANLAWRKNGHTESFDQLVKGAQLTISGYFKPDAWVDQQGTKHCRILFVATKISEVAEKDETTAETTKEDGKK